MFRRTLLKLIALAAASGVLAFGLQDSTKSPELQLRILATTDVHVNLVNYDYYQDKATDEYGLSKVASLIQQARAEAKNTLLFDNGDLLQGTPLGDYVVKNPAEMHPAYQLLNLLAYDAATLGNHEFNYGLPFLQKAVRGAGLPVVNANVLETKSSKNLFRPYVILSRKVLDNSGYPQLIKVGVIGLVPPQIMLWDKLHLEGKVIAADMVETARQYIPEMQAKGADLIVALAHTGYAASNPQPMEENAVAALSKVAGIDAIISGHSHLDFPSPTFKSYPGADIEKGSVNGVPMVMAGFWGNSLGQIDLRLQRQDGRWKVVSSQSRLRPIYDRTNKKPLAESHKAVEAAINDLHQATLNYIRSKVADLEAPINSYFALIQDDPSVQLVNNAQIWYIKNALKGGQYENLPVLSAAAPFKAGGRSGPTYYTDIPIGSLAIKNVADLYIYPNTIKAVLVTGAQLKEWLERSAGQFNQIDPSKPGQELVNNQFPTYNFDVLDGVSYTIDPTQPSRYDLSGNLVNDKAERVKELRYNGQPLDLAAKFVVATNNYRASGGGRFPGLDGKNIIFDSADENRQVIINYIASLGKVNPSADGNWKLAGQPGASVVFYSSPNAEKFLPNNIKRSGDGPEGFAKYLLSW